MEEPCLGVSSSFCNNLKGSVLPNHGVLVYVIPQPRFFQSLLHNGGKLNWTDPSKTTICGLSGTSVQTVISSNETMSSCFTHSLLTLHLRELKSLWNNFVKPCCLRMGYSQAVTAWKNFLIFFLSVGVIVGVCLGFALRPAHLSLRAIELVGFPGEIMLRLLKMLVLPLVAGSMISGIHSFCFYIVRTPSPHHQLVFIETYSFQSNSGFIQLHLSSRGHALEVLGYYNWQH